MTDKNEEIYNYAKEGHEYYLKAESFELNRNYQDAKVNYIKSIEIYENIIKIDPKNEDAFSSLVFHYFDLGTILSHLKEYKEAIESFKKSIENSKKLLEVNFDYWSTLGFRYLGNAFWGLGKIYFVFNEYESAKNIFKEALEYFKKINDEIKVPLSFLMLGYVYFNLKEFKNAKDSFKEALERYKIFIENMKTNIDKKNLENGWEYWGFDPSYCRNNNVDSKELDEYKKRFYFSFQKFNSLNFGDIYFDLACTHFNLKEYEEAEEIFKKVIEKYNDAIKSNPKNKEALVNLGIAYLNLGKTYSNLNKDKDAGENYNNAIEKLCKAYSFKSKDLNPFIINSLLTFINKDDKDYLLFNFTDKLKDIDNFFIDLICRYQEIIKNKNKEEQKNYKELLYSIYDLFESLRLNEKNDEKYIYHYTHKSIINNQKLCLYSKESKENKTFFDFLKKKAEEKTELKDFIENISKDGDNFAFLRSYTENTENKNGTIINTQSKDFSKSIDSNLKSVLNKANNTFSDFQRGLQNLVDLYFITLSVNVFASAEHTKKEQIPNEEETDNNNDISIKSLGLYKVLYLSKDDNLEKLNKIYDCLNNISKEDLKNKEIINLIACSLMPLKYLIKDESYSHEKEVMLMYLPSKNFIPLKDEKGNFYIETEPIILTDLNIEPNFAIFL